MPTAIVEFELESRDPGSRLWWKQMTFKKREDADAEFERQILKRRRDWRLVRVTRMPICKVLADRKPAGD